MASPDSPDFNRFRGGPIPPNAAASTMSPGVTVDFGNLNRGNNLTTGEQLSYSYDDPGNAYSPMDGSSPGDRDDGFVD